MGVEEESVHVLSGLFAFAFGVFVFGFEFMFGVEWELEEVLRP